MGTRANKNKSHHVTNITNNSNMLKSINKWDQPIPEYLKIFTEYVINSKIQYILLKRLTTVNIFQGNK